MKKETQQNKILRAFIRTICARLRVSTGTEALKLLCTSSRVKEVSPILLMGITEHITGITTSQKIH